MNGAAIAIVLLFAADVRASSPLIDSDRPGLADGSNTIDRRQFQVEFGIERDDLTPDRTLSWPILLRYGVTDAFELRVESGTYEHDTNGSGWDTFSLGFKDHLYERNNLSLALIGRVFFRAGSGEFESSRRYSDVRLAADIDLSDRWSINPNVGVSFGTSDSGATTATGAMTLQYNVTPMFNVFVDGSAQNSLVILDTGAAWLVTENTQFDFSIGWGAHGQSGPNVFWAAGISQRF